MRFILPSLALAAIVAAAPATAVERSSDVWPASARQPVFHRSQTSGAVVSHIRIPAIGLDEQVRAGVALSVIDEGVAHWVGTAVPGAAGNVVLAGHRTTHSRPFADLDRLDEGDLVYVQGGDGFEVIYRVSESFIVDPEDIWITYETGDAMLTMFACHPKGSARFRIVVRADLLSGRRMA